MEAHGNSLKDYLVERAGMVNAALNRILPADDVPPTVVHRAMRYSVLAGGKRLRPILLLAAAEAAGAPAASVLDAACGLELIHTYSLIHDDLPCMDDDDFRRGRPTCHRVFGEAMAVLAGDALLTLAFEVLAGLPVQGTDAARRLRVIQEVAQAIGHEGMIGGQVDDLLAEGRILAPEAMASIHGRKTGRLIIASLRAGVLLAGGEESELAALTAYGQQFGLAFQITDDILDVTGDAQKLGKSAGSDQRHQKATYPALFGLEESRRLAAEALSRARESLGSLGSRADRLSQLAAYVVDRDR